LLMSDAQLREEVLDFFASQFGVAEAELHDLEISERREDIWAVSALPPPGIASRRLPGLRILRRTPNGLKPTSAFLIHLGQRITTARVNLTTDTLEALLLGRRIENSRPDGFVALCYGVDVIGCGRVSRGLLQTMIPTGRRRELLSALSETSDG